MLKKLIAFVCLTSCLNATPTTLFWTTVTTDIVPTGSIHIDVDDYFTLNRHDVVQNGRFPTDIGLTYGLFDWNNLKLEVGVDYFAATLDPWYFNAKMGVDENLFFEHAPSAAIGIYYLGTRHRTSYRGWFSAIVHPRTDVNAAYYSLGKTLPFLDNFRIFLGGYHLNSFFGTPNGIQYGFEYKFMPATYCDTEYFKWTLCGDYASGKNIVGGGGFAAIYYFIPEVWVETGPVFFNSAHWNGRWKWSIQFNIELPLFKAT